MVKVNIYDLLSPLFFVLLFINDFRLVSISILLCTSFIVALLSVYAYRKNFSAITPEIVTSVLVMLLLSPMLVMELSKGNYYAQAIISVPLCIISMPIIFRFANRARFSAFVLFSFFVLTIIFDSLAMGDLNLFGRNVTYKILIFLAFCTFLSLALERLLFNTVLWGGLLLNLSRGGILTAVMTQLSLKRINTIFLIFSSVFIFLILQNEIFVRAIYISLNNPSEMARLDFIENTFLLMSNSSSFSFLFGLGSVNDLGTYPHNIFLELFLYGGLFQILWFAPVVIFSFFIFCFLWLRGEGVGKSFLFRFWVVSFIPSLLSGDLFYNLFFVACSSIILVRTLLKKNAFYNYHW